MAALISVGKFSLGLSQQLDKPGVKKIQRILELAKSSYVSPFKKLSKLIQVSSRYYSHTYLLAYTIVASNLISHLLLVPLYDDFN